MAVDPTYDLGRYRTENKKSAMLLPFPRELTMANYKEILEKYFVYFGLVEDLQNSVTQLACKLGFAPIDVPVLNVSPRHEEITADQEKSLFTTTPSNSRCMNTS